MAYTRNQSKEQTTQIGSFSSAFIRYHRRRCIRTLNGVISMVIFMQISQMGFMVPMLSLALAFFVSFVVEIVRFLFSCVFVFNRRCFFFFFVSNIQFRNGWQRMCTRDTIYITCSSICWPSQPQQQHGTRWKQKKNLNQSIRIFYELFF